jgi:hypothetical protein
MIKKILASPGAKVIAEIVGYIVSLLRIEPAGKDQLDVMRFARNATGHHPAFSREAAALAVIAGLTSRDAVLPGSRHSTVGKEMKRLDVIDSQLLNGLTSGADHSAVLAAIPIAGKEDAPANSLSFKLTELDETGEHDHEGAGEVEVLGSIANLGVGD